VGQAHILERDHNISQGARLPSYILNFGLPWPDQIVAIQHSLNYASIPLHSTCLPVPVEKEMQLDQINHWHGQEMLLTLKIHMVAWLAQRGIGQFNPFEITPPTTASCPRFGIRSTFGRPNFKTAPFHKKTAVHPCSAGQRLSGYRHPSPPRRIIRPCRPNVCA
jgi:hypothetical protein